LQVQPVPPGSPLDPATLRQLLLRQLHAAAAPLGHDERPTDAQVHDTRRALKRARALLGLSRPALDDDDYIYCKDLLRDAGRALAGLRDARVLQQTLQRSWRRAGLSAASPTLRRLGSMLDDADTARGSAGRASCARIALRKIDAVRHRLESTPWPRTTRTRLGARFRKMYRRGRRRFRNLGPSSLDPAWHEWRKQVKQYEHVLQASDPVQPGPIDAAMRTAHLLADRLGEDHDLAMLQARLPAQVAGRRTPVRLLDAISDRRGALQRRALEIGAALYADPPRQVERRLRSALRPTRGRTGRGS
jgi:CHAD domain-containing protein